MAIVTPSPPSWVPKNHPAGSETPWQAPPGACVPRENYQRQHKICWAFSRLLRKIPGERHHRMNRKKSGRPGRGRTCPTHIHVSFYASLSFFQTPAGLLRKAHSSHEASPSAVASSQRAFTRCAYVGCHGDISARLNGAACSGLENGIGPGVFLKPSGKASHHEKRFLPSSTCLYFRD